MGLFSNMDKTEAARGNGTWFKPDADFIVEVVTFRHTKSKKNKNEFFIGDFTIIETDHPEHRPDQACTWMTKLTGDWPELALADIKACIKAITGADDDDITESVVEEVIDGDGTTLAGQRLRISTTLVTLKNGSPFTKHSFYALEEGETLGNPANTEDESAA